MAITSFYDISNLVGYINPSETPVIQTGDVVDSFSMQSQLSGNTVDLVHVPGSGASNVTFSGSDLIGQLPAFTPTPGVEATFIPEPDSEYTDVAGPITVVCVAEAIDPATNGFVFGAQDSSGAGHYLGLEFSGGLLRVRIQNSTSGTGHAVPTGPAVYVLRYNRGIDSTFQLFLDGSSIFQGTRANETAFGLKRFYFFGQAPAATNSTHSKFGLFVVYQKYLNDQEVADATQLATDYINGDVVAPPAYPFYGSFVVSTNDQAAVTSVAWRAKRDNIDTDFADAAVRLSDAVVQDSSTDPTLTGNELFVQSAIAADTSDIECEVVTSYETVRTYSRLVVMGETTQPPATGFVLDFTEDSSIGPFSVIRGSAATCFDDTGALVVVGNNEPCFPGGAHDGSSFSGPSAGLQLEAAATNYLPETDFKVQSLWDAGLLVHGTITDPSGAASSYATGIIASEVLGSSLDSFENLHRSQFARAVAGSGNVAMLEHNSQGSIYPVTTSWARVDRTSGSLGTFYPVDSRAGTSTVDEVCFFGPQAEDGTFATSFIPSAGSATQRAAAHAHAPIDTGTFPDGLTDYSAQLRVEVTGDLGSGAACVGGLHRDSTGNDFVSVYISTTVFLVTFQFKAASGSNNMIVGYDPGAAVGVGSVVDIRFTVSGDTMNCWTKVDSNAIIKHAPLVNTMATLGAKEVTLGRFYFDGTLPATVNFQKFRLVDSVESDADIEAWT